MREFTLVNGYGERYSLTSATCLFHSPGGLGFERDDSYRTVGDRWVRVSKSLTRLAISGTISFVGPNPYDQYFDFLQFSNVEPLKLVYKPNRDEYAKDVYLSKAEKTELTKYGSLDVEVEFQPLTPWYRELIVITQPGKLDGDGVVFPVTWPAKWRSSESMSLTINSDSYMNSPCKLTIYGPIKNPKWTHYANGDYVADGAVTVDIGEQNHLVVDNTLDPYVMSVYNEQGEEVQDVYQMSDFSTTRFLNLRHGRNTIHVTSEALSRVVLKAEVKFYYESV